MTMTKLAKKDKIPNIPIAGRVKYKSVKSALKGVQKTLEELHLITHDKMRKGR